MRGRPGLIFFFAALFFLSVFQIAQEPQQSTPGTQSNTENAMPETFPRPTLSEIDIYKSARSLIGWSPSEIDHCAFLRGLQPAVSQDQLPGILERVGQMCTQSFHDFLNVTCDEKVVSKESTSRFKVRRGFHYTVLRRSEKGDLPGFEEYRTDLKGNPVDVMNLRNFSMITLNFTSTFLYFSLADQHDNHHRYFGIQTIRNRECHVVGFAQDPEKVRRASRIYQSSEHSVVALLQGMAWVDAQTFQILRVRIWLLAPLKDIGLSSQISTVDFFPVQPNGTESEMWLPRDVRVDALFRGHKIRNTHHYSNYKLFRVESTIEP